MLRSAHAVACIPMISDTSEGTRAVIDASGDLIFSGQYALKLTSPRNISDRTYCVDRRANKGRPQDPEAHVLRAGPVVHFVNEATSGDNLGTRTKTEQFRLAYFKLTRSAFSLFFLRDLHSACPSFGTILSPFCLDRNTLFLLSPRRLFPAAFFLLDVGPDWGLAECTANSKMPWPEKKRSESQ
jgi:hypothetical protein